MNPDRLLDKDCNIDDDRFDGDLGIHEMVKKHLLICKMNRGKNILIIFD